jgi:hypothetical protein
MHLKTDSARTYNSFLTCTSESQLKGGTMETLGINHFLAVLRLACYIQRGYHRSEDASRDTTTSRDRISSISRAQIMASFAEIDVEVRYKRRKKVVVVVE